MFICYMTSRLRCKLSIRIRKFGVYVSRRVSQCTVTNVDWRLQWHRPLNSWFPRPPGVSTASAVPTPRPRWRSCAAPCRLPTRWPTAAHERNLIAARLAADVCGTPTFVLARTDAESAKLITADVDERDREVTT